MSSGSKKMRKTFLIKHSIPQDEKCGTDKHRNRKFHHRSKLEGNGLKKYLKLIENSDKNHFR